MRIGALLTLMGVVRLAQIARSRLRISLGLSGALLEVLGLAVFAGEARGPADFIGLVAVLFALLKGTDPASGRDDAMPQVAWRPPG